VTLAVLVVLLAMLSYEAYTIALARRVARESLPPNVGNFEPIRAPLEADPSREEFEFAVVGDPNASKTFERIIARLRGEPLSFLVLLGDMAPHARPRYHRFLLSRWVDALAVPFPVFCVVGNHDVDDAGFTLADFERTYGPSNCCFSHRGCLFILLRILDVPVGGTTTRESLEFLRSTLAARREGHDRVFLFLHVPPTLSKSIASRAFEGAEEFLALCDQYRVDYVFCGDHHGYARVRVRATAYLVSGGGGAPLRRRKSGHFYHAVVLRVGRDRVEERVLQVGKATFPWGHALKRLAIARYYPWMAANRRLATFLTACTVAVCGWLLWRLLSS